MFQFFRSTPMNTVFPLLQSCFLYPFYCPLTHPFLFHWRKRQHLKSFLQTNITHLSRLCFEEPVTIIVYCRGVINVFTQFTLTRTFLFTDKTYFVRTSKYFRKYCHKIYFHTTM
jgi:hypothetical protein